tara:strand:- start:302 stop:424 length:123 start_codon:yes stop_codon:yes gene_type:complete
VVAEVEQDHIQLLILGELQATLEDLVEEQLILDQEVLQEQ